MHVRRAVHRALENSIPASQPHRHRIPLGLLMLEKGWITPDQLRRALNAQKERGQGRIGEWLVRMGFAEESTVTRALSTQWSCPVLPVAQPFDGSRAAAAMPRLFVELFGALPMPRSERRLYLGFEEKPDPVLALAVEEMAGTRVDSGVVDSSQFRSAHARVLGERFPAIQLVEAVSESAAAHALARAIERTQPAASRLVRVHGMLWLRMFLSGQTSGFPEPETIADLVCSIGSF